MTVRQHTRRLFTGAVTLVPGLERLSERATGGTNSPDYCYWVWLRHLVLAARSGLPTDPTVVAELGPGDSLGTGVAALLTGADTYVAVDLVAYATASENVRMVAPIRALLAARAPLPIRMFGDTLLESSAFPTAIVSDDRLRRALADDRVAAIERAVADMGAEHDGITVGYTAGAGRPLAAKAAADVVFSQAVLEHVDDLPAAYASVAAALRPGGFTSHAIDFKSHGFSRAWNGHWTFGDCTWAVIRGRRRFAINRAPLSRHLALIDDAGLDVVAVHRVRRRSEIDQQSLAPRFHDLSRDDLETAGAVVVAVKRA